MSSPVLPGGVGADLTEVAPAIARASGKARRDIAFIPLLVIAVGAVALILAQLLRPASSAPNGATVPVTIGLSAAAVLLCVGALVGGRRLRAAGSGVLLHVYASAAVILIAGLTVIAGLDEGLASPAVGAAVIVAPTAGLALPTRWSRAAIVAIVTAMVGLHVLRPEASVLEAASIVGLAITGWIVGLILRRGHRGASRDALLLSRGDQLTGALNRRGFIETVAFELDRAARGREPVLLFVIGFPDGLAAALDRGPTDVEGPLADAAATLAHELPAGSSLGRLGPSKLGVFIPGGRAIDAEWFASTARSALGGRATIFCGAACSPDGSAPIGELYDVAEACLLEARRRSPQGVQLSEVVGHGDPTESRRPVRRPAVTYARLRAAGGPPASVEPWGIDGQWLFAGLSTVALAGLLFVIGTLVEGGGGVAHEVVTYLGLPWVVTALAVGYAYRKHPRSASNPPLLPVAIGSALVIGGIAVGALSTGSGVLSPIIAGLYLKAFFDASTFDRRIARPLGVAGAVALLAVLALGSPEAWWVAPFELALLLAAFSIGAVGHDVYDAATSGRLDLARTDPFTGLLDRGAFYEKGEALLAVGNPADRGTFAVVLIDVDPLSPVVSRGPVPAAPRTPRRTAAGVVAQYLKDASVVARFGSGDFRAIVRVDSRGDLEILVDTLRRQVATAASACRVGGALYGPDGVTLDALLAIASYRAQTADEALPHAA